MKNDCKGCKDKLRHIDCLNQVISIYEARIRGLEDELKYVKDERNELIAEKIAREKEHQ